MCGDFVFLFLTSCFGFVTLVFLLLGSQTRNIEIEISPPLARFFERKCLRLALDAQETAGNDLFHHIFFGSRRTTGGTGVAAVCLFSKDPVFGGSLVLPKNKRHP